MLKAEDPNDLYEQTRQSFYLRFTSSSSCPFQSAYDYLHRRVRRQPRLLALDAEVDGNTAIQLFAAEMSIYENAILCHETPPEKPTAPAPGQTPANDTEAAPTQQHTRASPSQTPTFQTHGATLACTDTCCPDTRPFNVFLRGMNLSPPAPHSPPRIVGAKAKAKQTPEGQRQPLRGDGDARTQRPRGEGQSGPGANTFAALGGTVNDRSDKNSNLNLQEPFLKLTNSIKHPNLPQQNSNAVQKKRRYPLVKISRPSRRRGPDRRRGWQAQAPLAVTFRFHVPVGDWKK